MPPECGESATIFRYVKWRHTRLNTIVKRTKSLVAAIHAADEGRDERLGRKLYHSMDKVRHEAAAAQATTPRMALIQLAMAIGELDSFDASWIANRNGDDALVEIQRVARSAFAVMERDLGINREDIGADYFVSQRVVEPWGATMIHVSASAITSETPADYASGRHVRTHRAKWKFRLGDRVTFHEMEAQILARERTAKVRELYKISVIGESYRRPIRAMLAEGLTRCSH